MHKAEIEISEEIMDKLSESLDLPKLYDEDVVDDDTLSYAIELMVRLCAD